MAKPPRKSARPARPSKAKPAPKAARRAKPARPSGGKKPARAPKAFKAAKAPKAPRPPKAPRVKKPAAPPVIAGRDVSGKSAKFAIEAARLMDDLRCTEVVVLDVRGKSGVTDYIVVASGTSDRQMRSVADAVADLGATMDHPSFRTDGDTRSTWLVLDCVDVVVHLFEPSTRTYYDLETMWGDAPRIAWARAEGDAGPRMPARPRSITRYEDQAAH